MARSNGQGDRGGAQAPQWRYPTDQEAQTRPPQPQQPAWGFQPQGGHPAPQVPPQQAYPQHAPAPGGQHHQMFGGAAPQPYHAQHTQPRAPVPVGYGQPAAPQAPDPYAAPAPGPYDRYQQPVQQQPSYPQYGHAQQQQPTALQSQAQPTQLTQPRRPDSYSAQIFGNLPATPAPRLPVPAPQSFDVAHSAAHDLRGGSYEQWPAAPDPRGYDLGGYTMPGATQVSGAQPQLDPHLPQPYAGQAPQSFDQWTGNDPYGQPALEPAFGDPAATQIDQHLAQQIAQHAPGAPGEETDEDEEEDSGGGYRGVMIAAALVFAILLGGGLAYAYKTFLAPRSKTASGPPTIRSTEAPARSKPADPGGKQFANQDSKVLGRLNEDSDANGVRKVVTVPVGRDGSIAGPPQQQIAGAPPPMAPAPQPQQSATTVPGLFLDTGPRPPQPPSAPPAQPQQRVAAAAPQPPVPPQQPVTGQTLVTLPQVQPPAQPQAPAAIPKKATIAAATAQPAAADAAAAPPAVHPPKKPKTRDDYAAGGKQATAAVATGATDGQTPAPAALGAAPRGSTGFVAVLASKSSQMDALRTIADLQQRYSTQLNNRMVTVQEADLTAQGKGIVHRVIVGPPASRELTADVCTQLKAAGHKDCWLAAY